MTGHTVMASAVLAGALLAGGTASSAQSLSPRTFDAGVGVSYGGGGSDAHDYRLGIAVDGMFALRSGNRPLVLAIAGAARATRSPAVMCPGSCRLDMLYPAMAAVGGLLGVEATTRDRETLRLLAGPAYYWIEYLTDAVGVQGRADVALPSSRRLALVLSLRGDLLPSVQGQRYHMLGGSVGVRFR